MSMSEGYIPEEGSEELIIHLSQIIVTLVGDSPLFGDEVIDSVEDDLE